eukprot:12343159-Ditylum_brightwellii.AAC.1
MENKHFAQKEATEVKAGNNNCPYTGNKIGMDTEYDSLFAKPALVVQEMKQKRGKISINKKK